MARVAISIVNFNCLEHTKNLIMDLDRQTYGDYHVYLFDQNSEEDGTREFLEKMRVRPNYTVIQNGYNKPLNHIWNDFAGSMTAASEFLCFLNNDIRIPSNFLFDTVNVLSRDGRIGIAIHATNNRDFSTATSPTRHIFETGQIKQGWEFTLRRSEWVEIPPILKFYCGDDFIFFKAFERQRRIGVITSSPIIHKLSQTREKMGEEFISEIKKQALEDIENYKRMGFPHHWNNLAKQSRLEPELKQIIEISTNTNTLKISQYSLRLLNHLSDIKHIEGDIIDVGVNDLKTFDVLLTEAMHQSKRLLGIEFHEFLNNDVVIRQASARPVQAIKSSPEFKNREQHFKLYEDGFLKVIDALNTKASFIFVGILNSTELRASLPKLWSTLSDGGCLFFPYYHNNSAPECTPIIDEFLSDKVGTALCSRVQTKKGINDTYLAIKKFENPIPYIHRKKPLVIASVLKTGGVYDDVYVNRLARAVKENMPWLKKYKFCCLTDSTAEGIDRNLVDEIIPLEYNLPGWWSKMELFRPELFVDKQVLYFDLDTLITDDISDFISYGGDFLALRDFNTLYNFGSGILGWNPEKTAHIFHRFIRDLISNEISISQFLGGDQEAIEHFLQLDVDWVQDLFPGKMAAFKYQCYDEFGNTIHIPDGTSVVCFHGKPKMGDLEDNPVIRKYWLGEE